MAYSNVYLPAQMSGPVTAALEQGAIGEFTASDSVLDYLEAIAIATANPDLLTILGWLVGMPWPIPPIGTYDEGYFTLCAAADSPMFSSLLGLSSLSNPATGGLLSSVAATSYEPMPINL